MGQRERNTDGNTDTKKKSPHSSMFDGHTCMNSQSQNSLGDYCISAGNDCSNGIYHSTEQRFDASTLWRWRRAAGPFCMGAGPQRGIRKRREEAAVYYKGIGPERGKRVREEDAFSYACERCVCGTEEEQAEFLAIAKEAQSAREFAQDLVDWYYSGSWIKIRERREGGYGYAI